MTDPFMPDDDSMEEKPRTTISLAEGKLQDVKNIADFWNSYAEIQGKRRVPKWSVSSAIERMVNSQLDAFWHQVGLPQGAKTPDERKAWLESILDEARAKKSKKKT